MRRKQTPTETLPQDDQTFNEHLSDPEATVVIIIQRWKPAETMNVAENMNHYVQSLFSHPPLWRSLNINTCVALPTLCAVGVNLTCGCNSIPAT